MLVVASSNVTIASGGARVAFTFCTPATFSSAFRTVIGHVEQSMSGTESTTDFCPANEACGTAVIASNASAASSFLMIYLLVKKRGEVREYKSQQHKRGYRPEHHPIDAVGLRERTERSGFALGGRGCPVNPVPCQSHEGQRDPNEHRAVWL